MTVLPQPTLPPPPARIRTSGAWSCEAMRTKLCDDGRGGKPGVREINAWEWPKPPPAAPLSQAILGHFRPISRADWDRDCPLKAIFVRITGRTCDLGLQLAVYPFAASSTKPPFLSFPLDRAALSRKPCLPKLLLPSPALRLPCAHGAGQCVLECRSSNGTTTTQGMPSISKLVNAAKTAAGGGAPMKDVPDEYGILLRLPVLALAHQRITSCFESSTTSPNEAGLRRGFEDILHVVFQRELKAGDHTFTPTTLLERAIRLPATDPIS
ncbi:hypothetical protein OF83DRAFT_387486 [Amylostereum chailletii]|nr:hypothetical protein OF83DRAFT_387486 [Amylostereum chailletii]